MYKVGQDSQINSRPVQCFYNHKIIAMQLIIAITTTVKISIKAKKTMIEFETI